MRAKSNRVREGDGRRFQGRRKGKEKSFCFVVVQFELILLPQFYYADTVWDNCSGTLSNMLENLHLEAIRIILGAVRGTSHEKLSKESGFAH